MSGAILFEQPYRGDVWRLEIASHDGRTFGNWRKWYREGDTLKPTRQGVTIRWSALPSFMRHWARISPGKGLKGLIP